MPCHTLAKELNPTRSALAIAATLRPSWNTNAPRSDLLCGAHCPSKPSNSSSVVAMIIQHAQTPSALPSYDSVPLAPLYHLFERAANLLQYEVTRVFGHFTPSAYKQSTKRASLIVHAHLKSEEHQNWVEKEATTLVLTCSYAQNCGTGDAVGARSIERAGGTHAQRRPRV
jgi:hypothetical protein